MEAALDQRDITAVFQGTPVVGRIALKQATPKRHRTRAGEITAPTGAPVVDICHVFDEQTINADASLAWFGIHPSTAKALVVTKLTALYQNNAVSGIQSTAAADRRIAFE
jgi:hypothetical protein